MVVVEEQKKTNRPRHLNLIALMNSEPRYGLSNQTPDFVSTIESFGDLSNIVSESYVEAYETGSFKKNGHTWKLMMHPNGDAIRGGKGYISLYLVLQDSPSFPVELKVFATFSFFIFNQTELEYVIFPDKHDWDQYGHKFNKVKNGYGYSQLISLETLKNSSSGYLMNDTFIFGVNVTVKRVEYNQNKAKLERLCNSGGSLIRTSFKFSELENEFHETDAFTAGAQQWVLRLYPGWTNGSGNYLSVFLRLSCPKSFLGRVKGCKYSVIGNIMRCWSKQTADRKVHARFRLRLVDQLHNKHVEKTVCGVYSGSSPSWGCSDFVELCQLRDQSYGYIKNDNLIVEVDFSAILARN